MSQSPKPKQRNRKRENTQRTQWEKERRDRLNEQFDQLWKVLPTYDASRTICKADILMLATDAVKELNKKLKKLLKTNPAADKDSGDKLKVSSELNKKLQDRVRKLLLRNEQLTQLLRITGIKIPSDYGIVKRFKKSLKYSNALSKDQRMTLLQKELEKNHANSRSKRSTLKSKSMKPRKTTQKKSKKQVLTPQNCVIMMTQPNMQQLVLSKPPIRANVQDLTQPIVVKPTSAAVSTATTQVESRTVFMENGSVMSFLPNYRPFSLPTILTNPLPKLFVVQINANTKKIHYLLNRRASNVALPTLRPRTTTTQINKMPIPALTSKYNKPYCLENKKEQKTSQKKVIKDPKKSCNETSKKVSTNEAIKSNGELTKPSNKESIKTSNAETSTVTQINTEKNPANFPLDTAKETNNQAEFNLNPSNGSNTAQPKVSYESLNLLTSDNVRYDLNALSNIAQSSQPMKNSNCLQSTIQKSLTFEAPSCQKDKSYDIGNLLQTDGLPHNDLKNLEINFSQTELSNDLFASFHVPPGCQNQESTSPTAAFLLTFPLVSSGTKAAEVMGEENSESQPNLLQIGTMDSTRPTQTYSDNLTPNLLNFESFSCFNNKDIYPSLFSSCNIPITSSMEQTNSVLFPKNDSTMKMPTFNKNNIDNTLPTNNSFLNIGLKDKTGNGNNKLGNTLFDVSGDIFSFKPPLTSYPLNNKQSGNNVGKFDNFGNYKNICDPQYSNSANNFYNSFVEFPIISEQKSLQNNCIPKSISSSVQEKVKPSQNKPINWMTTPTTTMSSYKPDYFLPPFTKNSLNPPLPTTTFNTFNFNPPSTDQFNLSQDFRKSTDLSYQLPDDIAFSWSPSKMPPQLLENSHTFVPSTLPTLLGDLALNNAPPIETKSLKERRRKPERSCESSQSIFFSVSQLVEQESAPGKIVSRRNSGNRLKTNSIKPKRISQRLDNNKEMKPNFDNKQRAKNRSSYSAEALIGSTSNNSCIKPYVPTYDSSVTSYFPHLDAPQENSFQNYQMNNFSQIQPTTGYVSNFMGAPTYTTTSYSTTCNNQDFLDFQNSNNTKDKYLQKQYNKELVKEDKQLNCKKAIRKRPANETALPSFDVHFLSTPGAINSPILPDDFPTPYLPPSTLYPAKNGPLYPTKQKMDNNNGVQRHQAVAQVRSRGVQPSQISPNVNSGGTSLTNFNLSTIFPEINKGPGQDNYQDNPGKEYITASKTFRNGSSNHHLGNNYSVG